MQQVAVQTLQSLGHAARIASEPWVSVQSVVRYRTQSASSGSPWQRPMGVGVAVGAVLGETDGAAVGDAVGVSVVGDSDGEIVGEADGEIVGEPVGRSVKLAAKVSMGSAVPAAADPLSPLGASSPRSTNAVTENVVIDSCWSWERACGM